MAGLESEIRLDGLKAHRISWVVWALHHAVTNQCPTDKLLSPGEFFGVMNAGVGSVIHIDQHDPAILLGEGADRSKRFIEGLREQREIRVDACKGKNRVCSPCNGGMIAQGFR